MRFETPALIRMDLFRLLLLSMTTPIILGSLTETKSNPSDSKQTGLDQPHYFRTAHHCSTDYI